jgi:sec-independent protein translocase protein TatA
MGSFGIWHILILGAVALVLFGGKGKISDLMGDFGKGVSSFKKGLSDGAKEDPKVINGEVRTAETLNGAKDDPKVVNGQARTAETVNNDRTAAGE